MAVVAKVVCMLLALMVVASPAAKAAIQCGDLTINLMYCSSYLKGGPGPNEDCCAGVQFFRLFHAMALTRQDELAVCGCLKSFLGSIPNLINANAAALPRKCGASVPYPISPKIDCSKVH